MKFEIFELERNQSLFENEVDYNKKIRGKNQALEAKIERYDKY